MKIVIIGNGGSGKSTLGFKLSGELGIAVTHLDKLSRRKDFVNITEQKFTIDLYEVFKNKDWIIEGWAYQSTVYERLKRADVIIYLKYPLDFCVREAVKRNREYHNRKYPFDPFEGDRNSKERMLIDAINRVHDKHEPVLQLWIKEFKNDPNKKIIEFTSRDELNKNYDQLAAGLKQLF
ncbi:hypothetical protein BH10BAC5_BH10BAC5_02720 [soil metagenome]